MTQHSEKADDSGAVANVKTFYIGRACKDPTHTPDDGSGSEEYGGVGWYWLKAGDPHGPFATEAEALADAQSGNDSSEVQS